MRVLIIGSDTPVGLALCEYFTLRGREFVGLPKADCRWKSERQAKKSLRRSDSQFTIDTRLQAAADGGIRVHEIDVKRSLWLARASQILGIPFLHLSAARVFRGAATHLYREEDHPDGESSIARLLIEAEAAFREHCEKHVILRTGPIFSPAGINVATHMLEQLRTEGVLTLSRLQQGCPSPAEDAARVVSGMLDQFECGVQTWGIYHYCSSDITNCHEFAEVLLAAASRYRDIAVDAVQLAVDDKGDEPRVLNLDCTRIKNTFAIKQQAWRTHVAGQIKQYYCTGKIGENHSVESN